MSQSAPNQSHVERPLRSSASTSDIIIGMADGLIVPFAPVAVFSGSVASSSFLVTAGIAEIVTSMFVCFRLLQK